MSIYYDREGKPLTMSEWASAFETREHVGKTEAAPGVDVSTVWLGLDHNYGGGPPMIFETMVFGGPLDQDCERYHTEAEALAGHERWVIAARAAAEQAS